jgi:hypothetical protein
MKINQDTNLLKQKRYSRIENSAAESFDFADFGKAITYPFKFKKSLVFGATIFTLFILGHSVLEIFTSMFVASIVCLVFAGILISSCLIRTIQNFSDGKTKSNFLPAFDGISFWDDIIRPVFLSLAVYFVSFGLLIILIAGAIWYAKDAENRIEADKQKILSVILPASQTNIEQNTESKSLSFQQTAGTVMRLSLVFSVPMFLALLWGIFYFPVACVIAAHNESFIAILNPSIGFDTVKRIGFDYWKIVGVFLILAVSLLGLNAILQTIFSPFDLPLLGNLPVKTVVSFSTFYLSIVFAVVLGITLFKNSARLKFRRV